MLKRCNYCMVLIIFIVNTSEFAYFFFKSGDSQEGRQRLLVLLSPGGIRITVARLALLGPNFINLVPNNTCWPQNFRLTFWLFFSPFPGWVGLLQELELTTLGPV